MRGHATHNLLCAIREYSFPFRWKPFYIYSPLQTWGAEERRACPNWECALWEGRDLSKQKDCWAWCRPHSVPLSSIPAIRSSSASQTFIDTVCRVPQTDDAPHAVVEWIPPKAFRTDGQCLGIWQQKQQQHCPPSQHSIRIISVSTY